MIPSSPSASRVAAVALAGTAVLLGGVAYAGWSVAAGESGSAGLVTSGRSTGLSTAASTLEAELVPSSAVTGSLVVRNAGRSAVTVTSAAFAPTTAADAVCPPSAVVFALTVAPSAATPLVLPPATAAGPSSTAVGYSAFMGGEAADGCQGATLTSALVLHNVPVGRARAVAGVLPAPDRPVGGPTTPTRAAVRWSAAPDAAGYAVERAPSGTTDWAPACGSSTDTPLTATSCTDTGLRPATAYAYRVTSVRGAWRAVSRFSGDVTTQPLPEG